MDTPLLRQKFLDYFAKHGHRVLPSAALVPLDDPTLLFTNAGMVPFKNIFQGKQAPIAPCVTTSQRCVRAGGKHNDLEQVGRTARHHTFFEMLGNFSFGDYFKERAIHFAWDFLVNELHLPAEKLWVTVFESDDESAEIWQNSIGVPVERIIRCGAKDNFWSMGDTGPCGPCTEIFYDHGPAIAGGPPGSADEDGDRFVEIWNLVFMQFNMLANGETEPLPKPCVDTGMGLERIAAVLQGVHDNYDTDVFQNLIKTLKQVLVNTNISETGYRVIADHLRAMIFLMADHVRPGNEGRGYVLRRIIRRAIRFAHQGGYKDSFLEGLVEPCLSIMGGELAFPDAWSQRQAIAELIAQESQRFNATIQSGLQVLLQFVQQNPGQQIPGELVFQLHDTHGFPIDLTAEVASEHQASVDRAGFDYHMQQQRDRARAAQQFKQPLHAIQSQQTVTQFVGDQQLETTAMIQELFVNASAVSKINTEDSAIIILDQTTFYAEGGGQVGDQGLIQSDTGQFQVLDTQKSGGVIMHRGIVLDGYFELKQVVQATVDKARWDIMANHTATHLLHAALRLILGDSILQKGSLVEAQRLRFDFTFARALTPDEIMRVEQQVNTWIFQNLPGKTELMSLEAAKSAGALALFNEKYQSQVRVVSYGDCSKELCGGTHYTSTALVGSFMITQETGVAAGVRRLEAVTRNAAYTLVQQQRQNLLTCAKQFQTTPTQLFQQIQALQDECRQLKQWQKQHQDQQQQNVVKTWLTEINHGPALLVKLVKTENMGLLRTYADQLRSACSEYAFVLIGEGQQKQPWVCAVSPSLQTKITAPQILAHLKASYGASGGGRTDFVQGAMKQSANDSQCDDIMKWILSHLE